MLVGSGYDTRALRYARGEKSDIANFVRGKQRSDFACPAFFEIDLPVVTRAKGLLSSRYAAATGVRQPPPPQ